MKIDNALKYQNMTREYIKSLFSRATHYGLSHDEMLRERNEIYDNLLKKTPYYVKSYLSGVWDTLTDELYRNHLVYGGKIEGIFYSTHKDLDNYYEKHGIEPREFADNGKVKERGHYWKHNLRPFFICG